MFRMISVASMRDSTRAFNGLTAASSGTQRVVGFMIMIGTKRLAIINIETFVWEWLLSSTESAIKAGTLNQVNTNMTHVAVEAVFMIFALELAVRG